MLKFKDLMERINETRSLNLEEVEGLDELSTDALRKYRAKAKDDAEKISFDDDGAERRMRKRSMGSWDAGKKILKRGDKLRAEEVEQTDEALKGSQHKIDANKNGKVDGHDFKILRNAKKARYQ
jgi:hypothetical protein